MYHRRFDMGLVAVTARLREDAELWTRARRQKTEETPARSSLKGASADEMVGMVADSS